jgi:hypothetical protein
MRFILLIAASFTGGAYLLSRGYREDAVTILVLIAVSIAAEIHKPEKETIKAGKWALVNLKWICIPFFTLSTLWR